MSAHAERPRRLLHTTGAVAIVVGIVVGAGIFKTPAMVAGITQEISMPLSMFSRRTASLSPTTACLVAQ